MNIRTSPGPWTRKKLDANHSMIHAADGMTVVPRMISEPGMASEANADLIAAAVTMRDKLKGLQVLLLADDPAGGLCEKSRRAAFVLVSEALAVAGVEP